jgi:tetratricopeptide (TPR) repeat protein
MNNNKQIQKISKLSLEKLSEDSKLVKKGLRDLNVWPKIEELFNKLRKLYEVGEIQECITIAEEILKTDSYHFFTLCYYGRSLYLAERYEEALKIFNRCLEEKEYYFLWLFRGDCYYRLSEYKKAKEDYEKSGTELLITSLYSGNEEVLSAPQVADVPKVLTDLESTKDITHFLVSGKNINIEELIKKTDEMVLFKYAVFLLFENVPPAYENNNGEELVPVKLLSTLLEKNPKNKYAKNLLIKYFKILIVKQIRLKDLKKQLEYINLALLYFPNDKELFSEELLKLKNSVLEKLKNKYR